MNGLWDKHVGHIPSSSKTWEHNRYQSEYALRLTYNIEKAVSRPENPRELVQRYGCRGISTHWCLLKKDPSAEELSGISTIQSLAHTGECCPVPCPWQCRGWAFSVREQESCECTLLSDVSINALRTTTDAVRVIGSHQAQAMSITLSLMEARRSAYNMYNTRMAEEREREDR